ncbi:MAG: hypothetical protein EHM41_22770 [Chloroflexi bacterium]|nr:MAG: hypothetical protein EHM41_22770 [Chloroflexota bacterium]
MYQIFTKKFVTILLVLVFAFGAIIPVYFAQAQDEAPERNLVQLAYALNREGDYQGQFNTLIAAIMAADPLVLETLASSDEQLTVFAPTDDAFAEFGLDATNIHLVPVQDLTRVLLYHVAGESLDAEQVLSMNRIPTLLGRNIAQQDGVLTDRQGRQASIIAVDLMATNGIVHAIDAVLLPTQPETAPEPTPEPTPSLEPTPEPTLEPTPELTSEPTPEPTLEPTP